MGDEVKITVIATGFRQEMPERRARMLTESTLTESGYQVPIRPAQPRFASELRAEHVAAPTPPPTPAAQPPVAAQPLRAEEPRHDAPLAEMDFEEADEALESISAGIRQPASFDQPENAPSGHPAQPELIPVPASVFDDDFFRTDRVRARLADTLSNAAQLPRVETREPEAIVGSGTRTSAFPGYATAGPMVREYAAPESTGALYAGASGSGAAVGESDELDIPAFLRRGH